MRIRLFWARQRALRRGYERACRLGGVLALAFSLFLVAGAVQAQAALAAPEAGGTLAFTAPSYSGTIGGPPGTRVTVHGSSWIAYNSVALALTTQARNCNNAVALSAFPTTSSGTFTASFNWPAAANQVGAYYVCGIQGNKDPVFSHNTFSLLSSSPASLSFTPNAVSAGDTITLSGSNWLPAPQTVNIVVVPCQSLCAQPPVAQLEVVTGNDGSFTQSVTISSNAVTNGYYVQATNSLAAIAATAGPLRVTGQAAPSGTPSVTATRPTQGGLVTPPSNTKTALKDALVAAGLGLLALLVLIGVVVFFLTRARRGPDLHAPSQSQEPAHWDAWSAEGRPSPRPGTARRVDDTQAYWEMPQLPPSRHSSHQPWADEQPHPAPAVSSAVSAHEDVYPWTKSGDSKRIQRVDNAEEQRSERAERRRAENASIPMPPHVSEQGTTPADDVTLPAQRPPIEGDAT